MGLFSGSVPLSCLLVDPLDDELVRAPVATGLVAAGRLAPGRHGVTATGGPALATTMRVVDGVHDHAADGRADAHPAGAAGLADLDVFMLEVADGADGRVALQMDLADLTGGHAELGVVVFLGHELGEGAGGAGDLAALARLHL